jgi:galactokinase
MKTESDVTASPAALANQLAGQFEKIFGHAPRWIAAAPGRVNLIGEHTDYNGGFVFPMAVERYTIIAAAPSANHLIQLRSTVETDSVTIDPRQPVKPLGKGSWANYPVGVIAGFLERGQKISGFDALIHSTVPMGGGLSSSAALEVATATLLENITGHKLDPVDKALLCQKAEHDFAGMPCGIMDQFISVLGKENHLLLLDCQSRTYDLVPLADPAVQVLIINSNVKHELSNSQYPVRRRQCETAAKILGVESLRQANAAQLELARSKMDDAVYRRARHIIGEIERTVHAAKAMRQSDWSRVGELMYASHASLRDDYEVSCAELDALVEIARGIGVGGGIFGCRMTGGGFGGCCVALVKSADVPAISARIAADYEKRTGIKPTLFVSHPAGGAMAIRQ